MRVRDLPPSLSGRPFTIAEAGAEGYSWKALQRPGFRRVRRGQYCDAHLPRALSLELTAVLKTLPISAVFSGMTALAVCGLPLAQGEPIEVSVRRETRIAARAGIRINRTRLDHEDIAVHNGFPITKPLRSAFDLACRPGLVRAVIRLDAIMTAGLVDAEELRAYVACRPGLKGIRRARRSVLLARRGPESPPETQLRLILVLGGLPEPAVQHEVRGPDGQFIARVDLAYPDLKVALEYDGAYHQRTLAADNRRQNALVDNDWQVLRFADGDLDRSDRVTSLVGRALRARGIGIGRHSRR